MDARVLTVEIPDESRRSRHLREVNPNAGVIALQRDLQARAPWTVTVGDANPCWAFAPTTDLRSRGRGRAAWGIAGPDSRCQ